MNPKELFLQWLDDQGLLEIYLIELSASNFTHKMSTPIDYLRNSFLWECPSEVDWRIVSIEWRLFLDENTDRVPLIFNERF